MKDGLWLKHLTIMYLIFDTETTGLPSNWNAPVTDTNNWPRIVQIAWQLHDAMGQLIEHKGFLITPDGFNIPYDAQKVHGISTQLAQNQGEPLQEILLQFNEALSKTKFIVGQNLEFDVNVTGCEFYRMGIANPLQTLPVLDTCTEKTAQLCQIPGGKGGKYKLPNLTELYQYLFSESFNEAHNATADVEATTRCFFELVRKGHFSAQELQVDSEYLSAFQKTNPTPISLLGLPHQDLKKASEKLESKKKTSVVDLEKNKALLEKSCFVHLHNYTQFSVLQSTTKIEELISLTAKYKMPAVALTDKANMMGAFAFVESVSNYNKKHRTNIKAIVGCELNVCKNHTDRSKKDNGYQIVMLAKNKNGYHNLIKMSSIAYTRGFYYVPRVDRQIVEQYKQDIIVLTGNTYGEVPSKILAVGDKQAEEALLWWHKQFGENLYIELMRHNREEEDKINATLLSFAEKHQIKTVATNHTFYLEQQEANAHDILLCVRDGQKQQTPKGRGRGYRYGLPNEEYYFKSPEQMKDRFKDIPQAILNIQEIVDKIEPFELARKVLLPVFDIPKRFQIENDTNKIGENDYLKFLTYQGAKERYGEITDQIKQRLEFELGVIKNTGYPGYFLIVEDFTRKAREMGVSVGPGRGSAAGSVVAYCLKITNIDPIRYDLLFERFLNPERISMPDIDIDFDDEGRQKVIDYVIEKYGANQVAQIITYGSMAAKSAIRDTARVLDLPLFEADRIAKLIPPLMSLAEIFSLNRKALEEKLRKEELENVEQLKVLSNKGDEIAKTINQAQILEGSVRNTGTHACGVIITPGDITDFVPVTIAKDSDIRVTQFDNDVVENAGLLKMDFLGLKTLTIIKEAVALVKRRHKIDLNPDEFPLEDAKTYELFQKGETKAIFQYESDGMQKYMKDLKPTVFADLIAMNALYRPGPLEYIPSFIRRKHGREPIEYDLPEMEPYLAETYGITVYQEQVMLLSQKLANFTKGQADILRKAMGKKQAVVLAKMKSQFIEGAVSNGHNAKKLEKIWKDWEAFASYAFNKSHSTCYAYVGYQTAYLKAHYPAEYMAAVLSNNMYDIDKVSTFMQECKRMSINVLGPDINESYAQFSVSRQGGAIRFGMAAIKGVGISIVDSIIKERENGDFISVFDMVKRLDLNKLSKKVLQGLVLSGALDGFKDMHRAQYYKTDEKNRTFLENILKFGQSYQKSKSNSHSSLFGDAMEIQIANPKIPKCEPWDSLETLNREKEVVGMYISAHPLDNYKHEMSLCNREVSFFENNDLRAFIGKTYNVGGIVTFVDHRISKNGKGWGQWTLEDYKGKHTFRIFGDEYLKFKKDLEVGLFLCITLKIKEGYSYKDIDRESLPRIQFLQMIQLKDVLERCKKVEIGINLQELTENTVQDLRDIFLKHQMEGKQLVTFAISHQMQDESDATQNKVYATSHNTKIKLSKGLLQTLEAHRVNFKLRLN